jgi:hypothetical protein
MTDIEKLDCIVVVHIFKKLGNMEQNAIDATKALNALKLLNTDKPCIYLFDYADPKNIKVTTKQKALYKKYPKLATNFVKHGKYHIREIHPDIVFKNNDYVTTSIDNIFDIITYEKFKNIGFAGIHQDECVKNAKLDLVDMCCNKDYNITTCIIKELCIKLGQK